MAGTTATATVDVSPGLSVTALQHCHGTAGPGATAALPAGLYAAAFTARLNTKNPGFGVFWFTSGKLPCVSSNAGRAVSGSACAAYRHRGVGLLFATAFFPLFFQTVHESAFLFVTGLGA